MTNFGDEQKEFFSNDFNQIKFSGQEINAVVFEECVFIECDLSEATFIRCKFVDCKFIRCNLSVVKFDYSIFIDVVFRDSKVIGVDWTKVSWPSIVLPSPIKFLRCIINDTTFFGLSLRGLVIEECKANDVDFREGDYTEANFTFTDFTNCLFSGTNLTRADFTKAVNYRININHNKINKAKFSWHEAVNLLEGLDIELVD